MQILNTEAFHHGLDRELSKKVLHEDNFLAYKNKNLLKTLNESESKNLG